MVLCESSTTLYIQEKEAHSLKINDMKMFYGFCSAGQVYDAKTIYFKRNIIYGTKNYTMLT